MNVNNGDYPGKPIAHIQAVVNSLLHIHPASKAQKGQRFVLSDGDKKLCFILLEGHCDVARGTDALTFFSLTSPGILGFSDFSHSSQTLVISASGPVKYLTLPTELVLQTIKENNLWESTTYFLMYMAARYQEYLQKNTSLSSYDLIRNNLHALSHEPFDVRATTTALKYIGDRTNLSRSLIMKILGELNNGEFIVIKRGLLITINKLPEKY